MKSSSPIIIQHFNCSSMGTRFDFLTYGLDEDFFSTAKNYFLNELNRIEQKFSRFETSGNTPNNRTKFGNKGHILNPLTGEFQIDSKTVSVATLSPIDAEVLSTSLFIATDSDRAEIISRFNPIESIEVFYNQWSDPEVTDLNHDMMIPSKNLNINQPFII